MAKSQNKSGKKKNKSKKSLAQPTSPDQEITQNNLPPTVANEQADLSPFREAQAKLALARHDKIGQMFDKAADYLIEYLADPAIDQAAKLFPAKLSTEVYLKHERNILEDQRIRIEQRKLDLAESKGQLGVKAPVAGGIFIGNQTNVQIQNPTQPSGASGGSPVDLLALKRKQEEYLSKFLPPANEDPNGDNGDPKD